ncbi:hypothetical protein CPB97_004422 [Podila verticillata]|nr:hypothetical protein CPB97_004422 [Podila verticillata]
MEVSVPPQPPYLPPPTLGETILTKLYDETAHGDVIFTFDKPVEFPPAYDGLTSEMQAAREQGVEAFGAIQEVHDSAFVRGSGHLESHGAVKSLKAHRLILTQWPYFKTMFESGFEEGGPGEKRIRIKDTKISTFELLLRFMSTGRLAPSLMPTTTYSEDLEAEEEASVEDLFLAAHRYDVEELCKRTLTPLLAGLDVTNALSFLFRTAYKFDELRRPVIRFVAQSSSSDIPRKEIRNTYKDHPCLPDILMDLLEVSDELRP